MPCHAMPSSCWAEKEEEEEVIGWRYLDMQQQSGSHNPHHSDVRVAGIFPYARYSRNS